MKDILRISVASAILALSVGAGAVTSGNSVEDLPILQQEPQHSSAAKRISTLFTREHYKLIKLDDSLSEKVYDRYLKSLDGNRNIFLASDIAEFNQHRDEFDEAILRGNLQVAYDMFNRNLESRISRYEYALTLLDGEFDFEKEGDKFYYDREEAAWPVDQAELDELWRQRVKYDALNLKLAGKVTE